MTDRVGPFFVLIVLALVSICSASAAEAKRIALVIGNSAYKVQPLANPVTDAEAVAAAFTRLGFDKVQLEKDLDTAGIKAALGRFRSDVSDADIAVVYYAGHGLENAGINYLIPVDATLARASDLDLEALRLGTVLSQLDGARKLKLVILDACRNNIFPMAGATRSQSRGLARVEPENNTLIAYAAAAGTTADDGTGSDHSPFTASLLKHIEEPGIEVDYVFRIVRDEVYAATEREQQPHLYGTLGRERIYFKPPDTSAPPATAAYTATGRDTATGGDTAAYTATRRDTPTGGDTAAAYRATDRDTPTGRETAAYTATGGNTGTGGDTGHVLQGKRIAFVVGINDYREFPPQLQLQRAVDDARAMRATFETLGFKVFSVSENVGRREFYRAWKEFLSEIEPGTSAAFYFAGHGMQYEGVNYLFPSDIPGLGPGRGEFIKVEAVNVAELQQSLHARKPKFSLLILDADRHNPFGGKGSGAVSMTVEGSLELHSAGVDEGLLDRLPGDPPEQKNSVFTRVLAHVLLQPNVPLQEVARRVRLQVSELAKTIGHKQTPAYYDGLTENICLAGTSCGQLAAEHK